MSEAMDQEDVERINQSETYYVNLAGSADRWVRGLTMITYMDGSNNLLMMADQFVIDAQRDDVTPAIRRSFLALADALRRHVQHVKGYRREQI